MWWWASALAGVMLVPVALGGTASATVSSSAQVVGVVQGRGVDGTCPPWKPYVGDPVYTGYHDRYVGVVKSRGVVAVLTVDVCSLFVGALGGEELRGSFTLASRAGWLSGEAEGTIGFAGRTNDLYLVLTAGHGTRAFGHASGSATLVGISTFDGTFTTFTATLTPAWTHGFGQFGNLKGA
jgi:hypothetical protein